MTEATLTYMEEAGGDSLDAVSAALEQQRRAVIKAYWRTAFTCLFLLPLAFLPGFLVVSLMTEAQWTLSFPALASDLRTWLDLHDQPVILASLGWIFVVLYLLGRYFRKYANQPRWNYVRDFKTTLYAYLCRTRFPDLAYDYDGHIGWDEFEETGLFPYKTDWYLSEDYFSGRIGSTDISFCEAHAKRERRRWTGKGNNTYLETYFQGLVFCADFHKHFHSTTRLIPKGAKVKGMRGERAVQFEDPEFNELFTTTSTDQTDVRYILSSSMLQRLVGLARRFPAMRARFHEEKLMLMLPTGRDLFEPSLYRRADSRAQLETLAEDISTVLPIVDELNLNTRIWSKQ